MKFTSIKTLTLVSLGVALVITMLSFVFSGFKLSVLTDYEGMFINFMYSFVLTMVNFGFFIGLEKWLSWQTQGRLRFLVGVVGSIALTVFFFGVCRFFHFVVIREEYTVASFWEHQEIGSYLFPLMLSAIISLFFHAFYFYKEVQENKVQEQKIIAGTASAKFDALKNQLDPHFLFNSLNVLTALIDENPASAQQFTASLSKVYRYVLEQKNKELVSLEEEIRFAKTYLGLLEKRFEESIQCELPETLKAPEAKIVPLSLQLLLENAVKHNVVSAEKPLTISIVEKEGYLQVSNSLQPKQVMQKGAGVGLQNIYQRYELLTSRKVYVQKNQHLFWVELPLLTKKVGVIHKEKINQQKSRQLDNYSRAHERVKAQKSFYGNLTAYLIIIPFLYFVNWYTIGFSFVWAIFPTIGWGIGLLFHYMEAFDKNPFFSRDWEDRKIREYMEEENRYE